MTPTDLKEWANAAAVVGVQALGGLLILAVIVILWRAQGSESNPFDAAQMFQDDQNRTSSSKFLGLIGGMASVFIVVYLAISPGKTLDPWLFVGWLGVIVLGKV